MKRKWGDAVPAWALQGAIDVHNFDLRVEHYGRTVKQWGNNWPFLSSDDTPATANHDRWHQYFVVYLGGFPNTYRNFLVGVSKFYNVPEARPELFDPTWMPPNIVSPAPKPLTYERWENVSMDERRAIVREFFAALHAAGWRRPYHGPRTSAPIGTVFSNYDEAVARHGKPRGAWEPGGYLSNREQRDE